MATVELNLPHHRYQIHIEPGLLSRMGEEVRRVAPHRLGALLFDASVREPHARVAQASLEAAGFKITARAVDAAEERKTLDAVRDLYGVLVDGRLERTSPVIALGGGVMGDSIGFLASTYLRGVPFVQSPTTLLAMVDASVGGKVGVNLPQGKNLVGSFYQPHLVLIDTNTLSTLPLRELRGGLAECVKHGVIRDPSLFVWIEDRLDSIFALDPATLVELVRRNVQIKANVVMADEKETGERAHLNFGHTFAHAIEAICGYGVYSHGEAVSLGMIAAARLAAKAGRCPAELPTRITRLLGRIGLPTAAANLPATERLMESMKLDKKVAAGKIRLVLPDRMGAVSIVGDTPEAAVVAAWESLRSA